MQQYRRRLFIASNRHTARRYFRCVDGKDYTIKNDRVQDVLSVCGWHRGQDFTPDLAKRRAPVLSDIFVEKGVATPVQSMN